MKEGDRATVVVIALVFVLGLGYCAAMWAHSKAVEPTCRAFGWQEGNSREWFTGYCYEHNEDKWQYHSCDLEYVLAGACEPMWPEVE